MIQLYYRYCLDKNYGGWLSIWDRIFGTFEEERQDEEIVYGLVDQPQFFDVIKHQMFYFDILQQKVSFKKLSDIFFKSIIFLLTLIKGCLQKKKRILGHCPKRWEGVRTKSQNLLCVKLGHEGG